MVLDLFSAHQYWSVLPLGGDSGKFQAPGEVPETILNKESDRFAQRHGGGEEGGDIIIHRIYVQQLKMESQEEIY